MGKLDEYLKKVRGINEVNLDLGEYGTLNVQLQYQFNLYNDKDKDRIEDSIKVYGDTPSEIINKIKEKFGNEITPRVENAIRQDIALQLQGLAQSIMSQRMAQAQKLPENIAFPLY
mgnify:CR=1 FL=1